MDLDAHRRISQRNSPEKDALHADRHTQRETSDPLARRTVTFKSQAPVFRKPENRDSDEYRAEMALLTSLLEHYRSKRSIPAPIRKRAAPRQMAAPRAAPDPGFCTLIPRGLPTYMLFEFASGYSLFLARGIDDYERDVESAQRYISRFAEVFELIAFQPFADALYEMNALSESNLTEELKNFLISNLPKPIVGKTSFSLAVIDSLMKPEIVRATKIPCRSGHFYWNVIRGLRMNIDKFIDLKSGDLEKAQLDLARSYSRQRSSSMYKENSMAASSSSFPGVVVVPHRFEGVFISKGKEEDALCTKNLVPGKALYDEELISFQIEDGIEAEYRVWNPVRSKLASAILSGVNNIWIKPGSRVLCLGDVSGTTVSHLSDLVGHEGLVYAVGFSEAVVNMAEKRSNVIPIIEHIGTTYRYRVVMGMVDVMVAEASYSKEVTAVAMNALHYLKAGGHYIVFTQGDYMDPSSQGEALFGSRGKDHQREFKPMQLVTLNERDLTYVVVGRFRMPE